MSDSHLLPGPPATTDASPGTPEGAGSSVNASASSPGARPACSPAALASRAARSRRLFAFASGKGGVGKSLLVANLGIQLARQGRTATLIDCDLASSTLHSYLGTGNPQSCIDDLLSGRSASLASLARDTSVPGLRLVAGSRVGWRALPPGEDLERLVLQALELPSDCVLIDLPSGRHPLSLDLLVLADYGVLVVTPEPGSLEAGFRLVEELARRALEHPESEERRAAEAVLGSEAPARGPAAFLDALADADPALANRLAERMARLRLGFVINQSRSDGEAQAGLNLRSLCRHYLGVEVEFGGVVEFDLSVWQATRQRKSLSQKYPNAPATRTIEQIASTLQSRSASPPPATSRWVTLAERTLYEMLEVPPAASQRDLQRAYDRLQAAIGPEAESLGGAVHPERVRAVRARVEVAYRTLVFLESRSEYDRSLLAAGRARPEELRDLRLEPHPALAASPAGSASQPPAPVAAGACREPPADAAAAAPAGTACGADADASGPAAARSAAMPSPAPADATPPPEVGPVAGCGAPLAYSGPVLAALRRERGLSLEAIAAVSKVRTTHLRCVEEERFGELPAPVFLKGFVREYARCLSLDPVKVWQDYLSRYQEWKKSRGEA